MTEDARARAMKIGFVGTGIMGFHMARRLAEAGYAVQAWNRSPDKVDRLQPFGVQVVSRAADAARDADVVIGMLSSGPVCDEVLLDAGEVLASMRQGSALIVMSSIPVETARRQHEAASARGVTYLDAPVSGGEAGAESGRLAIMVGGETAAFEATRVLFAVMGRPTHVGPAGSGQLAKLANQAIVASTIVAVAEALLFAERGGADPGQVREALLGGFADSTVLRQHGLRMVEHRFEPGGPAKYQVKDTSTALAFAKTLGLELSVLDIVDRLFADMVSHGDGDLDHSGIIREIRRSHGLPPDRRASG